MCVCVWPKNHDSLTSIGHMCHKVPLPPAIKVWLNEMKGRERERKGERERVIKNIVKKGNISQL